MTPDQLLTFVAVAERGNISHAANSLHLSQPAVSGQLRLLQDAFGEPLYQRCGRGIRLTEAGRQLAFHAERLRAMYSQAVSFRDALRGLERGALRVGASTTPANYLLPHLVADFHRRHPEISIHTSDGSNSEIFSSLRSLDIAMIEGQVPDDLAPDTAVHCWRDDEIVAVVPATHPLALAVSHRVTLGTLADYRMVWCEPGSGVRSAVEQAFARAGIDVRVTLELAGLEAVKEAVRAGMGVGFVSAMSMRHDDAALTSLRIGAPNELKRSLSILVPHASTPSRATQRFLDFCLAPMTTTTTVAPVPTV